MKKLVKKFILFEFLAAIFLIQGIQKLYFASQSSKFESYVLAFENPKSDYSRKLLDNTESFGDFIFYIEIWYVYGLIIATILIASINWRIKISQFNTGIIFLLLFSLFPLRFFKSQNVSFIFNSFGAIFTPLLYNRNLINGLFYIFIGILILLFLVRTSTTHNSRHA